MSNEGQGHSKVNVIQKGIQTSTFFT